MVFGSEIAAETVMGLDEPVEEIVVQRGRKGLEELPGIGDHISRDLETLVRTGEMYKVKEVRANGPGVRQEVSPIT